MKLSILDGRAELWQWDTGVRLVMDEACEAVNISTSTFGVSVDVTAAEDGKTWVAAVPDEMLQVPGDLICYAVQSTATGTITAAYRSFRINRRPKPYGYVATPTEARTWQQLYDLNHETALTKIDAPQTAQVGEVLTVEEVDEDGKPTKWKTQAVETEPPDWNASLDKPGYIKNRTHYKIPMTGAGSPGYKVNFLDGNHSVGDIVLLQAATSNLVKSFLIEGINNPKDKSRELCILTKTVYQNGNVSNLETVCEDKENIMEITTLSEGNVKALYSVSRKQCLAWYFISDLSTLDEEYKTKFTQVGAYAQWVDDYPVDDIAELWVSYQLYSYVKLYGRYLDSSVERTANKVDSIDKSSTAEQYPSAKSVYETINKKCADVMPQKTTKECGEGETVTLADNAEYRLTNVTVLTFAYPEDDFECWIRLTIAESGDVAVTFPEDTKYIGSAPTFANGEMWELSIKDGVVIAQKVGDGT